MINIYSCGCVAEGVPILSRCDTHNGYVCALLPESKVTRPSKYELKGFKLLHMDLYKVLRKIKDNSLDMVLSYPQHDPFYIRTNMRIDAQGRFPNRILEEYYRTLSSEGRIFLIVEYEVLAEALYAMAASGFKINQITTVVSRVIKEPSFLKRKKDKDERKFYVQRAGVLLSKKDTESNLPNIINLKRNADSLLDLFQLSSNSRVFDGSCIHFPFVVSALRKGHRVIGVVDNNKRYSSIVNYLKTKIKS